MIDVQKLLDLYKDSDPVHGLPLYAHYCDDGKSVFTPEYGILAVACFDADGNCNILGPGDFDVTDKNCSIIIKGNGTSYIRAVFPVPLKNGLHDIKMCFILTSPYPPSGNMIHFLPLGEMADYPYKD